MSWLEEPGLYREIPYIVVANDDGFRCGYILCPEEIGERFGFDYEDIPISAHGGLTYANRVNESQVNEKFHSPAFWIVTGKRIHT